MIRGGEETTKMTRQLLLSPLTRALPFLIVSDDAWETRRSELPVGRATKYGRLGSAGSLLYLAVE